MKSKIAACLCLALIFCAGCSAPPDSDGTTTESDAYYEAESSTEAREIGAVCHASGFEMKLFSDKQVYQNTDEIKIYATLEYVGEGETVTIWHGLPYMVFSITDGKDFNSSGAVATILKPTTLNKGEVYHFDYEKSGGYGEDDPDADFWRSFYAQKELYLPEGNYTVSVDGAFSLSGYTVSESGEISYSAVDESRSGLRCELPIQVINAADHSETGDS